MNLYQELEARGLVSQCTDENIQERLAKPVGVYCGFDPTADSLHVGSLVPIMGLAHLQRAGHKPYILVGGATGLVGDPSGKTEARQMLTREIIEANGVAIAKQIGRLVRFDDNDGDTDTGAVLVNNIDWFADASWIDMLREVGSRVSVNRMLSMESVKGRMTGEGDGITYLEFSYMLMQAYDFAWLFKHHNCTLQVGGQDQWGNIVMGIDLGRRLHQGSLAGLTFPLVTKSDGGKFGKSEKGNIWLDPARTSPYDFYQFWRNTADSDVGKYLGYFTFMELDEIKRLGAMEGVAANEAKEVLAFEVTKLVHGEAEADAARDSARKAFSGAADVTGDAIPNGPLPELPAGLLSLMVSANLAKSNGEARRLVQGGGVRIHDDKVADPKREVTADDVKDGYLLLRAGKKKMFRFDA